MKKNKNKAILGIIALCAAVLALAAGIVLSLSGKNPGIFRILSVPASVLIVAGGALLSGSVRRRDGKFVLREDPLPEDLTAIVAGISRGLTMKGNRPDYYVICVYTDKETGREVSFSGGPLQEYPGKEIIGKPVHVHVESYEDGKYQVDLRDLFAK